MIRKRFLDAFKAISDIPHPSGYTEQLLDFLTQYAKDRNFKTIVNNGNLIVIVPATKGYEDLAPVIVQAHFDMVAEKTEESDHDFHKDSLNLKFSEDNEWLFADNTTLGGDDGAGIAYMMLLMDEDSISHPELFLVFTRDEEIGILGALELDVSPLLSARYMINLDTEAEGYLTIGAGGGEAIAVTLPLERENKEGTLYEVRVQGLTGGHSGAIMESRAHATKLLAQAMSFVNKNIDLQIFQIDCPGKDNVITSSGTIRFISKAPEDEVIQNFNLIASILEGSYGKAEPELSFSIQKVDDQKNLPVMTRKSTDKVLHALTFVPTGLLIELNQNPRASANIGNCTTTDKALDLRVHFRFNSEDYRETLINQMSVFFDYMGATYSFDNYSPAWEAKEGGELQQMTQALYKETTGDNIVPIDVHGTVEGGVFSKKLPHLEIVSFGASVSGIHTPQERLFIPSAVRVYQFLIKLLALFNKENDQPLESDVTVSVDGDTVTVKEKE